MSKRPRHDPKEQEPSSRPDQGGPAPSETNRTPVRPASSAHTSGDMQDRRPSEDPFARNVDADHMRDETTPDPNFPANTRP